MLLVQVEKSLRDIQGPALALVERLKPHGSFQGAFADFFTLMFLLVLL